MLTQMVSEIMLTFLMTILSRLSIRKMTVLVATQILVGQQEKAIKVEPEEIAVSSERLGRPFNVKK